MMSNFRSTATRYQYDINGRLDSHLAREPQVSSSAGQGRNAILSTVHLIDKNKSPAKNALGLLVYSVHTCISVFIYCTLNVD